jgi:polyisoprenoid-binding protein YceI
MNSPFRRTPILAALAAALLLPDAALAGERYQVDPVHSTVIFKTLHFGVGYQYGSFRKLSGALVVDEERPARSSIQLEVEASSVFTANKKRDTHLRSPDFLSAKQFPKITFESTKVVKRGRDAADVTGRLTLRGVTKTVTVRMKKVGAGKDAWGNYRIGFEGTFTIRRGDYGITKMKGVAGEEIHLIVAVEGMRK